MPACDVGDAQRCVTRACPACVRALRYPCVDVSCASTSSRRCMPSLSSSFLASFFAHLLLPLAPSSLSLVPSSHHPLNILSSFSHPSLLFSSSLRQRKAQQGYPLSSCTLHLMSFNLPCEPSFYIMEPLATMDTKACRQVCLTSPLSSLAHSPLHLFSLPLVFSLANHSGWIKS